MQKHIIKIQCPDQQGLVTGISAVLSALNLNILSNHEFVCTDTNTFFMRTTTEGHCSALQIQEPLQKALPPRSTLYVGSQTKKKVVILVTKEAHCLGDLLIRDYANDTNIEIAAVIGNHETLKPLAEKFDMPFHWVNTEAKTKEQFETELIEQIDSYSPEFLVLAKFMRILSPRFVQHYNQRIINIHHSFLPAFIGANPYQKAYDRGVKIIGATAHFVSNDLDEGPIISQDIVRVNHSYSADDMKKAGRDVEKVVLARAIKLVASDRVFISGNKTIVFG